MGMNWKPLKRRLGLKDASGREASATAYNDFDEEASDWIDENELPDPEFFSPKRRIDLELGLPLHLRADELPDPEWVAPWDVPSPPRAVLLRKHYPTTGVITSILIPFGPALAYAATCLWGLIPACVEKSVRTDMLLTTTGLFFILSVFAHMGLSSTDGVSKLKSNPSSRTLIQILTRQSRSGLTIVLLVLALFSLEALRSSADVCRRWYFPVSLVAVYLLSLVGQACRYWLLKGFTKVYSRKRENLLLRALQRMSSAYDFIGFIFFLLLLLVPFVVIYMLIFRS